MGIESGLAAKKRLIEGALDRLLGHSHGILSRAMRYAVFPGGKRFRPLLLLSSGACFGVSSSRLLPYACAIEFIHSYSLVHDDLPSMDNDHLRRGKPTLHRAFGENLAILAGDGLLTLAFETMAAAPVPKGKMGQKQEAILIVSRNAGADGMVGGQVLDITWNPRGMSRAKIEGLIQKKTGALIQAAVEVGAVLSDARPAERQAVRDFGRNVGMAFQVRDDLLDARGKKTPGIPERPDYVALVGPDGAEKKMKSLIRKAIDSLAGFRRRGDELRHLALSLLQFEPEVDHG